MTTIAPPAKIKASLENYKQNFLDADKEATFSSLFTALVELEILQRGVLPNNVNKLMEVVTAVAGKALLDDSSGHPKSLLAGSAVIAGRIAEKCASSTVSRLDIDTKRALDRCREVNDERLEALLVLSDFFSEKEQHLTAQTCLFRLAEGYYYGAGTFQPDAPPMWKKAWDVVVLESAIAKECYQDIFHSPNNPWRAVTAIENLSRIAAKKGNTKRVGELSLRLAESALDATIAQEAKQHPTLTKIEKSFVHPHRPIQPFTTPEALKITKESLKNATTDEPLLLELLQTRFALVQEEVSVIDQAQQQHQKAKNCSALGKADKTLEEYKLAVRKDVLAATSQTDPLQQVIVGLRDQYFEHQQKEDNILRTRQASACLQQGITRFRDRARWLSVKGNQGSVWKEVQGFLEPLSRSFQQRSGWNASSDDRSKSIDTFLACCSKEKAQLVETTACICCVTEWMEASSSTPLSQLQFNRDVLLWFAATAKHSADQAARQDQKNAMVTSTVGADQRRWMMLEGYSAAAQAWVVVRESAPFKGLRGYVQAAIARGESPAEVGLGYLDCMLAWNGMFSEPWTYCTLPQARSLIRRAKEDLTNNEWGRKVSSQEECFVALAEADVEGFAFAGGLLQVAKSCCSQVLKIAERLPQDMIRGLFLAKARAILVRIQTKEGPAEATEKQAREALDLVSSMNGEIGDKPLGLWKSKSAGVSAISFQIAALRQLVASLLVSNGQESKAEELLRDAANEAPSDPGAAFALGLFLLRRMLFGTAEDEDSKKEALMQLLTAAKLDSSRAGPFALLGFWYEKNGDMKRSVGCYSKALTLDECHPVAGRGLLRLTKQDSATAVVAKAIASGTPYAGWAWRETALKKALVDGDDFLANVSFLRALRCRDISDPKNEPLADFFTDPANPRRPSFDEMAATLADLASCYRRLGRFTAAIRSYHNSIRVWGESVPGVVLCNCAQVELDLGLYDESLESFSSAIDKETDTAIVGWATYGKGIALLALAQRDIKEGKVGSSYRRLRKAIQTCKACTNSSPAFHKLLGDLYSFGATLPSDVFTEDVLQQASFVAKGADCYLEAEKLQARVSNFNEDEQKVLLAGFVTDQGVNKLRLAKLAQQANHNEGSSDEDHIVAAAQQFRRALNINANYAPAWCGLGCSVFQSDPLLSQHAFCRCIELDQQFVDAHGNLSFLYTMRGACVPSDEVSEVLTQLADTPVVWINRALLLERRTQGKETHESSIHQAADAYRAALQVEKDNTAMYGLAVTCRELREQGAVVEGGNLVETYLGGEKAGDLSATTLKGLFMAELGAVHGDIHGSDQIRDALELLQASCNELNSCITEAPAFNSNLVEKIIKSATESPALSEEVTAATSNSYTVSRQIVHNPDRGDLWLSLAKEMVLTGAPSEAVKCSVDKALHILTLQLEKPDASRSGERTQIATDDLSDALAMHYWVYSTQTDDPAVEARPDTSLQKSLLLCPDNTLARKALIQL